MLQGFLLRATPTVYLPAGDTTKVNWVTKMSSGHKLQTGHGKGNFNLETRYRHRVQDDMVRNNESLRKGLTLLRHCIF